MQLKELKYIVALADEGSISRAAERLYMAQSSLSQFLLQYETELGISLFVRTSKGIRPTAAGSMFIDNARIIEQGAPRIRPQKKVHPHWQDEQNRNDRRAVRFHA